MYTRSQGEPSATDQAIGWAGGHTNPAHGTKHVQPRTSASHAISKVSPQLGETVLEREEGEIDTLLAIRSILSISVTWNAIYRSHDLLCEGELLSEFTGGHSV